MARKGSGNPNYLGISDFIDTERTGEGMGLARNSDTRIKSPKGAVTNQPLSPFEEMQLQRNKFKMTARDSDQVCPDIVEGISSASVRLLGVYRSAVRGIFLATSQNYLKETQLHNRNQIRNKPWMRMRIRLNLKKINNPLDFVSDVLLKLCACLSVSLFQYSVTGFWSPVTSFHWTNTIIQNYLSLQLDVAVV